MYTSTKTECDQLYGWIKKWSHTKKSHPKWWTPEVKLGTNRHVHTYIYKQKDIISKHLQLVSSHHLPLQVWHLRFQKKTTNRPNFLQMKSCIRGKRDEIKYKQQTTIICWLNSIYWEEMTGQSEATWQERSKTEGTCRRKTHPGGSSCKAKERRPGPCQPQWPGIHCSPAADINQLKESRQPERKLLCQVCEWKTTSAVHFLFPLGQDPLHNRQRSQWKRATGDFKPTPVLFIHLLRYEHMDASRLSNPSLHIILPTWKPASSSWTP